MLEDRKCHGIKKKKSRVGGIRSVTEEGMEAVILNTEVQISVVEKVTFDKGANYVLTWWLSVPDNWVLQLWHH